MHQRGKLKIECSWASSPKVVIKRDGVIVGTADLDPVSALTNGREVTPMSPPEWDIAKERARQWLQENPKP